MIYRVEGRRDGDGQTVALELDCETADEAKATAVLDGIDVSSVTPVGPAQPTAAPVAAAAVNEGGGRQRASQQDIEFAAGLLRKGLSAEAVHGRLVQRGLAPAAAAELLNELFIRVLCDEAVKLLSAGRSPKEVVRQLAERGWEPGVVSSIVNDIVARHRAAQQEGAAGRLLLRFLGGVVFVMGIGLFLGNRTGALPTFPFAGFIVMGIGGLIWGAAEPE